MIYGSDGILTKPINNNDKIANVSPPEGQAHIIRDESRMGKSRTDRYRITDFVSFVPIVFEPDVKNENGTKTGYTKR
jgi:hypothetical protein